MVRAQQEASKDMIGDVKLRQNDIDLITQHGMQYSYFLMKWYLHIAFKDWNITKIKNPSWMQWTHENQNC